MSDPLEPRLLAIYAEFVNLEEMQRILKNDMYEIAKMPIGEESHDIAFRAILRTAFAYMEAMIFCLKSIALKLSVFGLGQFSPAEIAMLGEYSYELDDKGRAKTQVKFIPLLKNIRFAFEAGRRALHLRFTLNVGDARWDSFQKALEIRNRITHPKIPDDLHLSEEDLAHIKSAFNWFAENLTGFKKEFFDSAEKALKAKQGRASRT